MSEIKNKAEEYIQEVCNQIRWKKVHDNIAEELLNHMDDQKRAYIKTGQDAKEAEINTIVQMGDAVMVGQQLDRTHRPKPEWSIVAIIGVCIVISIAAQYIISINSLKFGLPSQIYFWDYLKALPFGIGIIAATYFVDYSIIGKYPKRIYGVVLGLCALLCLVDSWRYYGTYRHIFYFTLILMALYSGIIYNFRTKGYKGIILCGVIGIITDMVLVYASSIRSALFFTFSGVILLTVVIVKNWYRVNRIIALMLVWIPIILIAAWAFFYGGDRVHTVFLVNDDSVYSWVRMNARNILAGSQFIGQGNIPDATGNQIENVLPIWYNDYSLTYFIHKLGGIVAVVVIVLVAILFIRMFASVKKQTSMLGYIVSLSVAMTISLQCLNFLLVNLGISQYGSYPLPLISPGRASFLVNMALLGLLLSAYRNNDVIRDTNNLDTKSNIVKSKNLYYGLKIGKWELSLKKMMN